MTRKEAADTLKRFLSRIKKADPQSKTYQYGWIEGYLHLEDNEALDLAIKTLEQEPCDIQKRIEKEYLYESLCEDLKKAQEEIERLTKEKESCEDCISRQAACDAIRKYKSVVPEPSAYDKAFDDGLDTAIAEIGHNVPSVTPQPKTGRWIFDEILDKHYYCSECKSMGVDYWDYCPNCGAKMEVET